MAPTPWEGYNSLQVFSFLSASRLEVLVADDRPTRDRDTEETGPEVGASEASPEVSPTSLEAVVESPVPEGAAEAYHQRARLAEDRLAEVLAAYRKLKADDESYRERTTRTLQRQFEKRREALLLKFIDVLDNLDRALDAAQTTYAGQPLLEGLILVRTQVLQVLQDEGLERVPALGLPYDPHVSEAIGTEPVDDPDHHHLVVKELLRGYRLNGRVARASRVMVGQYSGPLSAPSGAAPAEKEQSRPHFDAVDAEPSLEDIIARAESQEALFPKAFEKPAGDEPDPKAPAPAQSEISDEDLDKT